MEREIYAYKCKRCGHLHYPYRMVCKSCRQNEHNEFEPVPLPSKGKLLTFTKLYNLPGDYEVPLLILGIVELENGLSITGQLRVEEPSLGMAVTGRVQVVRTEAYDDRYGMVFYEA